MVEDPRSARHLLDAKRQLNAIDRATGRRHLARLEAQQPGGLEASTLHLAMLRDLRRVNSHVSAIAYDVLGMDSQGTADDGLAEAVEPMPEDARIASSATIRQRPRSCSCFRA
jgi:phosphate:Na+ symporter